MTRTPIVFALSFVIAAGAGPAFAGDGENNQLTPPHQVQLRDGQKQGKAKKSRAMKRQQKEQAARGADTGAMSNRASTAADRSLGDRKQRMDNATNR